MLADIIRAIILGIVEGVTEFLPVSSTGHLLLAERFFDLGEGDFWKSFAVLIQLGAILAILALYFSKLWNIARGMFSDPAAQRFVIGVLVAFLPAAVIGAALRRLHQGLSVQPLGGLLHADRGRRACCCGSTSSTSSRVHHDAIDISAADVSDHRLCAVHRDDPGRVALRRHHRRRDAARRRQARGGGILVLPGDPDHGRRVRLRPLQEPRRHDDGPRADRRRSASWCRSSPRSSW